MFTFNISLRYDDWNDINELLIQIIAIKRVDKFECFSFERFMDRLQVPHRILAAATSEKNDSLKKSEHYFVYFYYSLITYEIECFTCAQRIPLLPLFKFISDDKWN